DTYGRMSWDKPAPTLTTKCNSYSNGRFGHPDPTQHRAISIREASRLQTFPLSYVFKGSLNSMAKQIGNAVPCELARLFGLHLIENCTNKDS
ncbi:DNA cytosine methyltransferase, partial [Escherichia coli]